ncbi:hypothetical protein Anas_06481 [Armadillidium nasatum]|uniref:Glycosyl hydrolases family 38 C-terminal domain-containing protein n=1 Tax=Armadillidium nasatum TaxID=96803 RepID=A0A5N5SWT4_9CRUS|nr:hypothetical protein Anas_06481 [Armadillidium nasatum]
MELMVHRRLTYVDGVLGESLNEQAYGEGLVVRGRHFLLHSDSSTIDCDFGCQRRTLAEELLLQPIITFSDPSTFITRSNETEKKSGLSAPLPDNIHLLTLEPWSSSGTWLLRLENFYEVNESSLSESVDVDLESLFSEWTVSNIRELVLGANAYKEDVVRLRWNSQSEETKPVAQEDKKVKSSEAVYSFSPMQIRTFLIDVARK